MKNKSWIMLVLMLAFGAVALTGCNTADGFGKDLKGAGEAIDRTF